MYISVIYDSYIYILLYIYIILYIFIILFIILYIYNIIIIIIINYYYWFLFLLSLKCICLFYSFIFRNMLDRTWWYIQHVHWKELHSMSCESNDKSAISLHLLIFHSCRINLPSMCIFATINYAPESILAWLKIVDLHWSLFEMVILDTSCSGSIVTVLFSKTYWFCMILKHL